MLIIGVIASIVGIAVALSINWFPVRASSQARKVDDLYDVLLIASVPVFVLVEVVVLYCVWKFRMKSDAVPGITTHYRITPVRNGSYAVVCAELCGLGHSTMRSTVHVVDPNTFRGWLAQRQAAKPAGAATS